MMPGTIMEDMDSPQLPLPPAPAPSLGFIVSHQKVEFDIDFASKSISGRTEITILPQHRELKLLHFNARKCEIAEDGVQVNGKLAQIEFKDPYRSLDIPSYIDWTAEQHEMQKDKIKSLFQTKPWQGELAITLPKSVRIEEINPFLENAPSMLRDKVLGAGAVRKSSTVVLGSIGSITTPTLTTPKIGDEQGLRYTPLTVSISFKTKNFRDGIQFVGLEDGDTRYPHAYTRHSIYPGAASCIFPCIDDPVMRCTWEVVVKCGKTLGDALRRPQLVSRPNGLQTGKKKQSLRKPIEKNSSGNITDIEQDLMLDGEDQVLEMIVVCSGDLTDEIPDPDDGSKKISSFLCANQVAAQHIGFAVGPFEQADLAEFREDDEDEKLGQKAVQVYGYCLPRRSEELRHTCASMAHAIDHFTLKYGSYPFSDYKLCFIDDQIPQTVPLAGISLCSTRMLLPEDIIDPEIEVVRQLIQALASQYIGVNIVPNTRADTWVVVGISYFITDLCLKTLHGNNEYRFRQKVLADKLVELDVQRPSLYALGETLHLGPFELDFMILKAPLVLFILDRRLVKSSGSNGLERIISKFFYGANIGEQSSDKSISTESFRRLCEKVGHYKVDSFFNQWILGAGCPRFQVTQRFNKKRLSVEMTIAQKQEAVPTQRKLEREAFVREFKEETYGVYAGEVQPYFTGPMTIRIHEADGTPYEHIVEIREAVQRIEIPYHTKYKRLKRSRREKERATAGPGADITGDNDNDVLLYCLGDVLQSQEEINDWGLVDWDPDIELKMEAESYEWIRMDADFEWICELNLSMPSYMYVSQLQQDRDVAAQQDSMLFLAKAAAHPLVSTILVRTLMDRRYFHGIRTMAADLLPKHATEATRWVGRTHLEKAFQEFFCYPGSMMPRTNNFVDKTAYIIKCAIPKAMAKIQNAEGKCPLEAQQFILDQLRFNDNRGNEFSDNFYIATLMKSLAQSLVSTDKARAGEMNFSFDVEDPEELRHFQQVAVEEIDRYRRMDEWIISYQNIYTSTALHCKRLLMKSNIIPVDPTEAFSYTHDGANDLVRIKAFECLIDIGLFSNDNFLRYLLKVMSTDHSPFVRERLFHIFGLGLATIAFGDQKEAEPTPLADDGLLIEQDADMEVKKAKLARTMSIEGALCALKEELNHNKALKEAIWAAVTSSEMGLGEQNDLLDICFFLYDGIESMTLRLRLPRYWKVEKLGHGQIVFRHTKKVRTKMRPKLVFAQQQAAIVVPRSSESSSGFMRPPKRPSPPNRADSSSAERPTKILRLPIHSWYLQNLEPSSSPPTRPPIPHFSLVTSTGPSPAPKMRIPLPSAAAPRTPLPDAVPSATAASQTKKTTFKLKLNIGKGS